MKDWTGNKKTTFVTLGASNHSDKEREIDDFYATDPHALEIFLEKLKLWIEHRPPYLLLEII